MVTQMAKTASHTRTANRLTERKISKALASRDKTKTTSISDGIGLYARIKPNGQLNWVFRYTSPVTKKRRTMGLGVHPVITLKAARLKRNEYAKCIYEGKDPIEIRHAANNFQTVQEVFDDWCKLKDTHVKNFSDVRGAMQRYLIDDFKHRGISTITTQEVVSVLKHNFDTSGVEATIKRISTYASAFFQYAVSIGATETNCCAGISKCLGKHKVKHQPSIRAEDLGKLFSVLETSSSKIGTLRLLMFNLLTLVRPGEASGAKWEEIDFRRNAWNIPAERMKMKKSHRVPLPPIAVSLLKQIKQENKEKGISPEYIFPSRRNDDCPLNSQTVNQVLKRNGYKGELVNHGFRAIGSTWLHEKGYAPWVVESVLAHEFGNNVAKAYNRSDYYDQRRKLMRVWSEMIAGKCSTLPILSKILCLPEENQQSADAENTPHAITAEHNEAGVEQGFV